MSLSLSQRLFGGKNDIVGLLILVAFIAIVLPLFLDIFRLNLVGKYLTYAFVAIGLVLCWGYGGILSLGQGVFFGLGGYCMAMFLKLEASSLKELVKDINLMKIRKLFDRNDTRVHLIIVIEYTDRIER